MREAMSVGVGGLLAWVVRSRVEQSCCRHGAALSVRSVPVISVVARVEEIRMVVVGSGRSETAGGRNVRGEAMERKRKSCDRIEHTFA